jgi:hypothetical protein
MNFDEGWGGGGREGGYDNRELNVSARGYETAALEE